MPHATHPAAQPCCPPQLVRLPPPAAGSRRRRLWELPAHAHCPVIGVCLPMPVLRRLADKVLGGQVQGDDYHLHSGVVQECSVRGALAEALQRELDQRCATALRRAAAAKSAEALASWWRAGRDGDDVAGALWATLTHARCDAVIEEAVLHDIHMLQHQLGAGQRADLQRLKQLQGANETLGRELAQAQQRAVQLAAEQARKIEQLQAELVTRRADLIGRDTVIASLWERLNELEAAAPGLKSRLELARECERQLERAQELERSLARTRQALEAERRRSDEAAARPSACEAEPAEALPVAAPSLADQAVLCVGGRPASVPVYRQLIERTGGRFLHHDGGEHDSPSALDVTLAAADLVICQTGCISHDAYWRVKDHCKRTGKRCVFVENPSRSGMQRALCSLAPAAPD